VNALMALRRIRGTLFLFVVDSRLQHALRQNRKFSRGINAILPVQSCLKKYSVSRFTQIKSIFAAIPSLLRGAYRDRHGRWVRDAMDAGGAADERAGCGRRSRVVLTPRRWRQALRSYLRAMVAKEPGHQGEREISR
jgi:hypothetical protein